MASKNYVERAAHVARATHACAAQIDLAPIRTQDAFLDWARSFARRSSSPIVLALSSTAQQFTNLISARDPRFQSALLHVRAFSSAKIPEVELGAVFEDGEVYLSRGGTPLDISEHEVERAALEAVRSIHELRSANLEGLSFQPQHASVLLIDDGSAALISILAAIRFLKNHGATDVAIALPESRTDFAIKLEEVEAKLILFTPEIFATPILAALDKRLVRIACGRSSIEGEKEVPLNPRNGLIICVTGNGLDNQTEAGRFKPAARSFLDAGYSVLSFDLLHGAESVGRHDEFLTPLLAHRLSLIIEWISTQKELRKQPIYLYGIGLASSATLQVAAQYPLKIAAIVAHSTQLELSHDYRRLVRAPTLLLSPRTTGELAFEAKLCFTELTCKKRNLVLDDADDADDADDKVARYAADWFLIHEISDEISGSSREIDKKRPPKLSPEASF